MKTSFFSLLLFLSGSLYAQIYTNNTPVNVPDATNVTGDCGSTTAAGSVARLIPVPLTDTITDPSKVTINLNLAHTWSGDVVAELRTPAGTNCALIKRLGAPGAGACGTPANLVAGNTLSFSAGNSTLIPYLTLTTGDNIPAGVYAPTQGPDSTHYPPLIPLCDLASFLTGVSVAGNWALVMYDYGVGDVGSIQSWQLVFAPGFNAVSQLGTEQEVLLGAGVFVWGNPFSDQLLLSLDGPADAQTVLHVYAVDGKEVYRGAVPETAPGQTFRIETSAWKSGMYTLSMERGGLRRKGIKIIKNG